MPDTTPDTAPDTGPDSGACEEAATYRILVTLTDETGGHHFAEWAEDVESWLLDDDGRPDFGAIFRLAREEYGRCTGSIYVDPAEGGRPIRVGWHFLSRQQYDRSDETYLRGAWVTIVREVAPAHGPVYESVSVGAVA